MVGVERVGEWEVERKEREGETYLKPKKQTTAPTATPIHMIQNVSHHDARSFFSFRLIHGFSLTVQNPSSASCLNSSMGKVQKAKIQDKVVQVRVSYRG